MSGFNCTFITYGKADSGKTWTMLGERPTSENKNVPSASSHENTKKVRHLFHQFTQFPLHLMRVLSFSSRYVQNSPHSPLGQNHRLLQAFHPDKIQRKQRKRNRINHRLKENLAQVVDFSEVLHHLKVIEVYTILGPLSGYTPEAPSVDCNRIG